MAFYLYDALVYERKIMSEYLEREIYERSLKSEPSIVKLMYRSNRNFNMPPPPPPRAYPGHLTPLPSRGGGNLIIRVFQGVGNLIPML